MWNVVKNNRKLGNNLINMSKRCKKSIKNHEKTVKMDLKYEKKTTHQKLAKNFIKILELENWKKIMKTAEK